MSYTQSAVTPKFGFQLTPNAFTLKIGNRDLFVCRDFRQRPYATNPILDCSTGVMPGHLEFLLFRKWLLILSGTRW